MSEPKELNITPTRLKVLELLYRHYPRGRSAQYVADRCCEGQGLSRQNATRTGAALLTPLWRAGFVHLTDSRFGWKLAYLSDKGLAEIEKQPWFVAGKDHA